MEKVNNIEDLKALERNEDITRLELINMTIDTYDFSVFPNLKTLYLYEGAIGCVTGLDRIEELIIRLTRINIDSIALPSLKELDMISTMNLVNSMKTLPSSLTKLSLSNMPLKPHILDGLVNLVSLSLYSVKLQDTVVDAISQMVSLKYLKITYTTLCNLERLSKLDLIKLTLSCTNVKDLSFIKEYHNLEYLKVKCLGSVLMGGIEYIRDKNKLKHLTLSGCCIKNIGFLEGKIDLETLNLGLNNIYDIGIIGSLINLREVILCRNKIVYVAPLAECKNLDKIRVDNNYIIDLETIIYPSDKPKTIIASGNYKVVDEYPNHEGLVLLTKEKRCKEQGNFFIKMWTIGIAENF